jgi:excisionase family DNA binding protein
MDKRINLLSTNDSPHGTAAAPAGGQVEALVSVPKTVPLVTVIEPLLIDLDTLCRLLSVSRRTGKRMVAEGAIPGICRPFGRSVRFELAAVRAWISKGCPRVKGRCKRV